MNLGRWIKAPKLKQRPAKAEDIEPLFNTFQRVRKLRGIMERYENVIITWKNGAPASADEWCLVVDIRGYSEVWDIVAYLLKTTDKAKAVRRAYGWGLKDEDGNVVWPPEREDDDSDDIDDDPYVARCPEPEIRY